MSTKRIIGAFLLTLLLVSATDVKRYSYNECAPVCVVCHPWTQDEVDDPFSPAHKDRLQDCIDGCLVIGPRLLVKLSHCNAYRIV